MEEIKKKILTLLGFASKSNNLAYGKEMIRSYINNPKIKEKLLIIPTDTGERVKRDILIRCDSKQVQYVELFTKAEISKAIGKINVSVIGIMDEQLSLKVKELISLLRQNEGG